MRALLKSYDLSDNEIKLYTEIVGKFPLTFNEIRSFMSKQSEEEIQQILDNLLEKKLLMQVKPQYSKSLPHYVSIPPIAAILNSITEFSNVTEDTNLQKKKQNPHLEKFQYGLFQYLEKIIQDFFKILE